MEQSKVDVCVVGAGFAGLAAARRLRRSPNNVEVLVLEARDRVGGRVWNRRADDGTVLSVGGTWLGKGQDRLFQLCAESGLATYPQYNAGHTVLRLDGKNRRYKGLIPKVGIMSILSLGLALQRLKWITHSVPIEAPWNAPNAEKLDTTTLADWIASPWNVPSGTAKKLLGTALSLLFTSDPNEVSLLGSMVLAKGGGGFQYYMDARQTETTLVDGGVWEVAHRIEQELGDAVRLSTAVRRISQNDGGVEVWSESLTVRAKQVIITAPPHLSSRIDYEPRLPPGHSQQLQRLTAGAIIRGLTTYPEPFWRKEGLSGESLDPDSPVPVGIDQTPRSGTPGVLSSYAFGPKAIELSRLGKTERRKIWLDALAQRYGPQAAKPRAFLETDWSAEEWSLGGMISHYPPGVLTSCRTLLRQPVGRIHWAGAERATLMHGLIEGAIRSGEEAADEVMAAL